MLWQRVPHNPTQHTGISTKQPPQLIHVVPMWRDIGSQTPCDGTETPDIDTDTQFFLFFLFSSYNLTAGQTPTRYVVDNLKLNQCYIKRPTINLPSSYTKHITALNLHMHLANTTGSSAMKPIRWIDIHDKGLHYNMKTAIWRNTTGSHDAIRNTHGTNVTHMAPEGMVGRALRP